MIKEIMRKTTAVAVSVVITLSMLGAAVPAVSAASKKLTLSANGKITALKAGRAVITVKTYNGKSAVCVVTVSEPVG